MQNSNCSNSNHIDITQRELSENVYIRNNDADIIIPEASNENHTEPELQPTHNNEDSEFKDAATNTENTASSNNNLQMNANSTDFNLMNSMIAANMIIIMLMIAVVIGFFIMFINKIYPDSIENVLNLSDSYTYNETYV